MRLASLLAVLVLAAPSRADFVYDLTTTRPGATGATVSAELVFTDAAVASGVLRRTGEESATFVFTSGGPPFFSFIYTDINGLADGTKVNPVTGEFLFESLFF
jgi:hypothetical protein